VVHFGPFEFNWSKKTFSGSGYTRRYCIAAGIIIFMADRKKLNNYFDIFLYLFFEPTIAFRIFLLQEGIV